MNANILYCNCECVINFVQCPCSIFCDSVTLIYACIIIIIIINYLADVLSSSDNVYVSVKS